MSPDVPTFREVVISRLESEARSLAALAEMVRDGDIGSTRELREQYIPHRIRALEQVASRRRAGERGVRE